MDGIEEMMAQIALRCVVIGLGTPCSTMRSTTMGCLIMSMLRSVITRTSSELVRIVAAVVNVVLLGKLLVYVPPSRDLSTVNRSPSSGRTPGGLVGMTMRGGL